MFLRYMLIQHEDIYVVIKFPKIKRMSEVIEYYCFVLLYLSISM